MKSLSVADDWSAVADAWDRAVGYIDEHSTAATTALLEALGVRAGESVLELASGPGTLAATWSSLVGPTGHVVVSDIAPGMVEVAKRRGGHLANVAFAAIDVSAIDRPDASSDVVACRMGLMFAPEPAKAFAEAHRVLRPGGRLGALTWGSVERNPWMTCVGLAAMMNGIVADGPPTGPGGIFSLGEAAKLESLATAAGLVDVDVEAIDVTFHAESIDAHVEQVSSLAGPLARAFTAATSAQLDAVRRTAAQLAADHTTSDGLVLPGQALLVRGRRAAR